MKIAIIGGPRTGKTTLADRIGTREPLHVTHSDDYIHLQWSEASDHLACMIRSSSTGVFEGVAIVRALRKLMDRDARKPVDRVIYLRQPHELLSKGQMTMAKGVDTVWRGIRDELIRRGVEVLE